MHQLWRYALGYLRGLFSVPVGPGDTTAIIMRVMPMDLDFLLHVNNGIYLSYLDHGRMNMIYRNGLFKICQQNGWYGVVHSESIRFKKSLQLFDKFTIETIPEGNDGKNFVIRQKISSRGSLMAEAIVRVRILKKSGGSVSPSEVSLAMNYESKFVQVNELV